MTPPKQIPAQPSAEPLKLSLDLTPSAPPLVQKELPVSAKVEVDKNGNATYMLQFDLSFLLAGGVGRAAGRLGKSAAAGGASAAAKTLAKGAAAGAAHGLSPAPAPSPLDALSDGLARGLENLFGPAPSWLIELADAIGI